MWVWLRISQQQLSLYHIRTHQSHLIMSQWITFWLTIILNQQTQRHVPHSKASVKQMQSRECLDFLWMRTMDCAIGRTSQLHQGKQPIMQDPNKCCRKQSSSTCLQMGSKTIWLYTHTHTHISAEQNLSEPDRFMNAQSTKPGWDMCTTAGVWNTSNDTWRQQSSTAYIKAVTP